MFKKRSGFYLIALFVLIFPYSANAMVMCAGGACTTIADCGGGCIHCLCLGIGQAGVCQGVALDCTSFGDQTNCENAGCEWSGGACQEPTQCPPTGGAPEIPQEKMRFLFLLLPLAIAAVYLVGKRLKSGRHS